HSRLHNTFTVCLLRNISVNQQTLPSGLFYHFLGLTAIFMLIQVCQSDVRTFLRKKHSYRLTYPAISPRDQSHLVLQLERLIGALRYGSWRHFFFTTGTTLCLGRVYSLLFCILCHITFARAPLSDFVETPPVGVEFSGFAT